MVHASSDLLIRNVRPLGADSVDVLVRAGRIAAVGAHLDAPAQAQVEEGGGALLLPGLVEGHTHLDKTMWGLDWYCNEVGPRLIDKIDNEREFRHASGHDAGAQSLALARAFLANGTTRLRTHVDVDTRAGLRHLEGVLHTRSLLQEVQQIQIVAFPQSGLLGRPGTAQLLDQSMAAGADVLGGLDPCAIDGDPVRSLDVLFEIAERHAAPIDIHLHEPGAMGAFSLSLILDRAQAHGLRDRVAISHGFCLGDVAPFERDALLARMAKLGVALITSAPGSRAVPPLMICRAAGVATTAYATPGTPTACPTCWSGPCSSACATTCAATTKSPSRSIASPGRARAAAISPTTACSQAIVQIWCWSMRATRQRRSWRVRCGAWSSRAGMSWRAMAGSRPECLARSRRCRGVN